MIKFKEGDTLICIKDKPLAGNDVGPALKLGDEYKVQAICLDSKHNQHLDVGLPSNLGYVSSYETEEHLPNGNKIHWCHPSRFELKK